MQSYGIEVISYGAVISISVIIVCLSLLYILCNPEFLNFKYPGFEYLGELALCVYLTAKTVSLTLSTLYANPADRIFD